MAGFPHQLLAIGFSQKKTNIPDVLRYMDPPDSIVLADVQFGKCPTK